MHKQRTAFAKSSLIKPRSIALRAALISLKHCLPMSDSLILSIAWLEQATLWTQDEHFKVRSASSI